MLRELPPYPCLSLLGRFRLLSKDGRDLSPQNRKARATLAFLALSPEGCVDRGRLSALLWSDSPDPKANLRQVIRDIRETFIHVDRDLFFADTRTLSLDLASMWVDVIEVRRLVSTLGSLDLERLAALCPASLLQDVDVDAPEFDEWLTCERTQLWQLVSPCVERSLRQSLTTKSISEAQRAAEILLALEPAHEEAHQALMRCHMLRGDAAAAIRQYRACRAALARELDLAPSRETERLRQEICTGTLETQMPISIVCAQTLQDRQLFRASVMIESRCVGLKTEIDDAVSVAIAHSLSEALLRNRGLTVLDPVLGGDAARARAEYRVSLTHFRVENRIRLGAAIWSNSTCRIIWADHLDRVIGSECFRFADECAAVLASRVEREVQLAEIARASQTSSEVLTPYDCVLNAIPLIFCLTPQAFDRAEKLLQQAQQANPDEPLTYIWWAFKYFLAVGQGWVRDTSAAEEELSWLLRRGIELDPRNAVALAVAGHISSFVYHDYNKSLNYFEKSIKLDPNSVFALDLNATTLCYTGKVTEALDLIGRYQAAAELEPFSYFFLTTACIAHMFAGQFDDAIRIGGRVIRENPNFQAAYRPLLASLGHVGRLDEASVHLASLKRLEPDFSISWFRENYPPLQPDHTARYLTGLRRAGVPE